MSRYYSYLNSARDILSVYKGEEPFASFIKKYFATQKKFGSRDRKQISNLCYYYFRASPPPNDRVSVSKGGISNPLVPDDLQLLKNLFLCSTEPNEILASLKPEWNDKVKFSIEEKLSFLHFQLSSVFPWKEELSDGIEYEKFCASFFVQPDLFLRIRPGHAEEVLLKLNEAGVHYEFISPFTIRLPNSFKADKYFELDKEVVVQDYSSQKAGELFFAGQAGMVRPGRSDHSLKVWDCCAGSGGKSMMAYDLNQEIKLTVSDVRESILVNLEKRFKTACIKKYQSLEVDLTHSPFIIHHSPFDLIIADVPCTGSGTWGRTPEQLFYFDAGKIDEYAAIQKNIVSNIIPHLQPGGHLLYITCSVFKKENEEVISYLKEKFHLQLVKMELLKGYQAKADTMFVALFRNPL